MTISKATFSTDNHKALLASLYQGQDVFVHGCAGTGKTYITLYYALQQLQANQFQRVIVVRSTVPTRDMGFLPGTEEEKLHAYEAPYTKIVNDIIGRGDAYEILKKKQEVVFISSSYLRGLTFDNAFIIVDEVQNMTFHEIDTIYTRVGENTQLAFVGDGKQTDNNVGKQGSGIYHLGQVATQLSHFDVHEFTHDDIVRSKKVKEWILTSEKVQSTIF